MMRTTAITFLAIAVAMLGACKSSSHSTSSYRAHGGNFGDVDSEIIYLYDEASPAGMIELEIDRNGNIYEAEADILPHKVPQAALDSVRAVAPGASITGAEIEFGEHGMAYEVKLDKDGVGWEFVVTADGVILETEREIRMADAPEPVIAGAMEVLPGNFKSVEILTVGDNEVIYHVKTNDGHSNYKAVMAVDGKVLRAVREQRAEIEIPLAR